MTQVITGTLIGIGNMTNDAAKSFDIDNITEWAGYNSSRDKTNILPNYMVRGSQNIYKKLSGNLSVREGQKRRGVADATESPISSEYVWNTSWGATYTLVISDSKLSVVIDDVWYTLLDSLTKTRYVFDKWYSDTEKKDRVLFVNGTDDMFSWSGGYAVVESSTSTTITKTGTTSWQQAGFSTTSGEKTIVINGVTYTYTGGENTTTLTGVTPDASVITPGATVLQAVQTHANKPQADFLSDFIKVINNQVHVGSYVSRLCFISSNTDFTDYTVPTPRTPGSPNLLTLDATLKGIGVRQGNAYIGFGSGSWAVIVLTQSIDASGATVETTKVDVKPVALQQAPYAHEFIDTVGDSLIYLAQDQQVRSFGDFNNLFTPGYPSLSQEIATELGEEDFDGGSLTCIGEFVYVCAPVTGNVYLYQVRNTVDKGGNVVAERLWHSPFVWNLTSVNELNGEVIGFSNANPQIYDLWDTGQWHDDSPSGENLPYECVLAASYRTKERQKLYSFDKFFTEGYITAGTELNFTINYNYQGATAVINGIINSVEQPTKTFSNQTPASLGDSSLGDEPLGQGTFDGTDAQEMLPKFKNINSLTQVNCFEYQPIIYSDQADARWEILAIGTNTIETEEQQAGFLINKRRV